MTFPYSRINSDMDGKLNCTKTNTVTARVNLSNTQAILDFVRNSDNARYQLIFNFESKAFSVSYYNGTTWDQRTIESW